MTDLQAAFGPPGVILLDTRGISSPKAFSTPAGKVENKRHAARIAKLAALS